MSSIKGKQLSDNTIDQSNMYITTDTIISGTSITNKEYVIQQINKKSGGIYQSILNQNMTANNATIGEKACNKAVIEFPISTILVKINGTQINVGPTWDCYFSPDGGITKRTDGNGEKGDYLYWNSNKYNLETTDEIDFEYLTANSVVTLSGGTTVTLDPVYNSLVVKYTGDPGTTMNVIIDGVTIVVGNVNNNFVWDIGGADEYIFNNPNESIVVIINGNNYTIWFDGFGSLIFSFNKFNNNIEKRFQIQVVITGTSETITIPHLSGYTYNYNINYGDNTGLYHINSYNDVLCTHTYVNPGTYIIKIDGLCETFYVNSGGTMRTIITDVLSWGDVGLKIINFFGCINLKTISNNSKGLSNVINFNSTFAKCLSLISIPPDLFKYSTGVTSYAFYQTFWSATTITSIPSDLFKYNILASDYSFQRTFNACVSLTNIPPDLFKYNILASDYSFLSIFANCTSLESIPPNLFDYNVNVGAYGFQGIFNACKNITSIPSDLFKYNTKLSGGGFYNAFKGTNITSIPSDLFRYNTGVTSDAFRNTFSNCSLLETIPTDLFKYNTEVSSWGFAATFSGCTNLNNIPTDLFRYNTKLINDAFYQTFQSCSSLTSIPSDLFRYNTLVSSVAFTSTFRDCISLTNIPSDLFRYNTAVSVIGFQYTFYGCTSLETIPDYLFKYNLMVSGQGFYQTFMGCINLQINPWTFYASGETGTRFLNKSPDFTDCFTRTNFTGTQGTAPDLWNCNFGTGTPTRTRCFGGTGNDSTSISNYSSIPSNWRT